MPGAGGRNATQQGGAPGCSADLWNQWALNTPVGPSGDLLSPDPALRGFWYLGAPSTTSADLGVLTRPRYEGNATAGAAVTFTCGTDVSLQRAGFCNRTGLWYVWAQACGVDWGRSVRAGGGGARSGAVWVRGGSGALGGDQRVSDTCVGARSVRSSSSSKSGRLALRLAAGGENPPPCSRRGEFSSSGRMSVFALILPGLLLSLMFVAGT